MTVSFGFLFIAWAYCAYLHEIKHDSMPIRAHPEIIIRLLLMSSTLWMQQGKRNLLLFRAYRREPATIILTLCILHSVKLEFLWLEEWLAACIQKTCCPCIQNIISARVCSKAFHNVYYSIFWSWVPSKVGLCYSSIYLQGHLIQSHIKKLTLWSVFVAPVYITFLKTY